MKKLAALVSSLLALLSPVNVFAASPGPGDIQIAKPPQGFSAIGDFVTKVLTFSFLIAVLVVLAMLIWGAFEWITSGGDKDSVSKARNRIVNALIGLAVLAVAFALARVAATFLGFPDFGSITVPTPNTNAPGL